MAFELATTNTFASVNADGSVGQINRLIWQAVKSDNELQVSVTGYTDIPPDYVPAQIPYGDITPADAEAWTRDLYPEAAIEARLDQALLELGHIEEREGLPWTEGNAYPVWVVGNAYAVDDIVLYTTTVDNNTADILYQVVQAHTSQSQWTPPATPALWTVYNDAAAGVQEWVRPTGTQDAYDIGDLVYWDNPNDNSNLWVYESAIAANTTEPGRDGTFDRWWTPVELYVP